MNRKLDSEKLNIIFQRHKLIAILLFFTLIPALINQFKSDLPISTMLLIDSFIAIPASLLLYSHIKKKLAIIAMYSAALANAVGFLCGMIDTGMYALAFLSLLLISIYQEWKVILLNVITTMIGFQLHFKQYIYFQHENQLALFYVMYALMAVAVIIYTISNEKLRKQSFQQQIELENSKKEIEGILQETSESEQKLDTFNKGLNDNLFLTKNISKEIVGSFHEITKGVETQTSSINNINLSLKDIGIVIDNVSESSKMIYSSSNETETITNQYGEEMKKVVKGMEIIAGSVESTALLIHELNEKNKNIHDIVNTLNNLSSQTNLLALNASIEAARAGDAGKGFAVVAEEVRKLAEDSKKSSGEIGSILNEIQTKTSAIAVQVNEGLTIIEDNKQTLDKTEDIFSKVSSNTRNIAMFSDSNEQIIEVLKESANSIINDMESIAATSEQVNASIEEILSSMENQNKNIDDILSSFSDVK